MTLQECYGKLHGNYEDAKSRLAMDRLIEKFMLKFLDDTSMDLLKTSVAEGNIQESFRAAHTLKGVCQNLSLTSLYQVSSQLTEELRNEDTAVPGNPNISDYMSKVTAEYHKTIEAIQELE